MLSAVLLSCPLLFGQVATAAEATPSDAPGVKRALIVCGHPGDAPHQALFAASLKKSYQGLTERLGFSAEHVAVYFGIDPEETDEAALGFPLRGAGTRDELTAAVQALREQLQPSDTLWVIVMGHAHFDGRNSWLNLRGPDLHQDDFGRLFRDLNGREQLFVITTPASGYYIKPLSAKGRMIISATEADREVNETLLPHVLADALNPPAEKTLEDADRDGRLTVFDVFIDLTRTVAARYVTDMLICTEHALLDDNGDGRGSELQLDYLTEEEGGRKRRDFQPTHKPGTDGAAAAEVLWPKAATLPPAAPAATE
jgi:hypothetical protein